MTFKEFCNEMKSRVNERTDESVKVGIKEVLKNNGQQYRGLIFEEKGISLSPTIYMESFYEDYREGKKLDDLAVSVIKMYYRCRKEDKVDLNFFRHYENVRKNIVYKLIHYERNISLLSRIPHVRFLDLAYVFYYKIKNDVIGDASILIYNSHMESWNIDLDTLYSDAEENTPRLLPCTLRSITDVIKDIAYNAEGFSDLQQLELDRCDDSKLYVLGNTSTVFGAASMTYKDVLMDFAREVGSDLYILPSSVHEVLLLPKMYCEDAEELRGMVRSVNTTNVEPEEVLSDTVYYFSRETGIISIPA